MKKGCLLVLLTVLLALSWLLSRGEIITLRPTENIPVGVSPVKPIIGTNLVVTLKSNEKAEVISCKDIKTNLIIMVRLHTGETGYVTDGNFILERKGINPWTIFEEFGSITFSCSGLFNSRSGSR